MNAGSIQRTRSTPQALFGGNTAVFSLLPTLIHLRYEYALFTLLGLGEEQPYDDKKPGAG